MHRPVTSGVLQTTGSMRPVSPGPDFHPGNFEDNEHIVVFPEKEGFRAGELVRVDMVDPGEYAKTRYWEKPTCQPGRRLTSYLLQLDAYPEGKSQPPAEVCAVKSPLQTDCGHHHDGPVAERVGVGFGIPNVAYPSARMD